jgi:hypothetical protein
MGAYKYTDFLFARPSFWEGAARILDFGDTLREYNDSPTPEIADEVALTMDWNAVGNDLFTSLNKFYEECLHPV